MAIYQPCSLIANRYEVTSHPLLGGMGIVYLCIDQQTDQPLALKTIQPRYLPNSATRDRFLQEGSTWVRLGRHLNIVQCYGVEYIDHEREVYLVLELVDKPQGLSNASLRSWLAPKAPLSIEQSIMFALQIARGMKHACMVLPGFVHRDLKPENLLVGADALPGSSIPRLRVTDFGLASVLEQYSQVTDAEESNLQMHAQTHLTNGIVGTPNYMAPEQWQGTGICTQSDIYAFGAILYEMLSGTKAVQGSTLNEIQANCLSGNLATLPNYLPQPLQVFLTACLANKISERPACWEQVVQALEGLIRILEVTYQVFPETEGENQLKRSERLRLGWGYNSIGLALRDIGRTSDSINYFKRVQTMGVTEDEPRMVAASLGNLASVYDNQCEYQQAIQCHEQQLIIAIQIGDKQVEGAALGGLGIAYTHWGDYSRAFQYLERALDILRQINDLPGESIALANLGNTAFSMGNYSAAIQYYKKHLAISRMLGDRQAESTGLGNLGNTYRILGDYFKAINYYQQHLATVRELGDREGEGTALGNLGNAYERLGDYLQAIKHIEQALIIFNEIGDHQAIGNSLSSLGNIYLGLGDFQKAIENYSKHMIIAQQIGDRQGEGNSLGNLGIAYLKLGDYLSSIQYYENALTIARQIGDMRGLANSCFNLAFSFWSEGQLGRALPLAQEAVTVFEKIGAPNITEAREFLKMIQSGKIAPTAEPDEILRQFEPLIQAAVDATFGNSDAHQALERALLKMELNGWHISDPIRQMWDGERDATKLTQGLDRIESVIMHGILTKVLDVDKKTKLLQGIQILIQTIVDATHGITAARHMLEDLFPQLEQNGWNISNPIRRIWAGERDINGITQGLEENDALIVREVLKRLS